MTDAALLAVDVGNTNVTLGVFTYAGPKAALAHHWRLATHREQTSDEVLVALKGLCDLAGFPIGGIGDAILSSVVPPLLPIWERVCTKLLDKPPLLVGPGIKTGMPVRYENPREVGADRIVNAVAAFELMGGPVIAVDFGTATTFDLVNAAGEYIGGIIAPGIMISAEALFAHASRLYRVDVRKPAELVGKNTAGAMQAGIYYGYIGLVDGILERLLAEIPGVRNIIATGGQAPLIAAGSKHIREVDPDLTLTGLKLIYERNRS